MELFEYIKSQLPQMPNSAIMKQMGASEELIDYVKETPWNTNLAIVKNKSEDGGGDSDPTYTIHWEMDTSTVSDTTGLKIGDFSIAPLYTPSDQADYMWQTSEGTQIAYALGPESYRTFEFTEELANKAENYIINAYLFGWQ